MPRPQPQPQRLSQAEGGHSSAAVAASGSLRCGAGMPRRESGISMYRVCVWGGDLIAWLPHSHVGWRNPTNN